MVKFAPKTTPATTDDEAFNDTPKREENDFYAIVRRIISMGVKIIGVIPYAIATVLDNFIGQDKPGYTLVDKLESPLVATVEKYLAGKNDVYTYDVYISPEIPIQKVANTLSKYAHLEKEEKIIALVDLSVFNNAKAGIAFTNQGILWNDISTAGSVNYSDPDYLFKIKHLPTVNSGFGEEERDWYNLALELGFRSVETTLKELKA